MSHFTVLVTLPPDTDPATIQDAVAGALAPYDENREDIEPYRAYEEGNAVNHWFARALRRDLEGWTRIQEIGEDAVRAELIERFTPGYDPRWSLRDNSPSVRAAQEISDYHAAVALKDVLTEDITWETVARLYNEKYHMDVPGRDLLIPGNCAPEDIDREWLHIDDEGRAYTWSMNNPVGYWDWWIIGGRWQRTLLAMPDVPHNSLVWGRPGAFGKSDAPSIHTTGGLWCDGGRIRDLDISGMRLDMANKELDRFEAWEKITNEHGTPPAWSELVAKVDAGELSIETARTLYNGHPAIQAHRDTDIFGPCPVDEYGIGRDAIVERAALSAVPGYALIDLDGKWIAPGKMGWFGMSSDSEEEKAEYQRFVNRYLELDIDPESFVVLVDCHV